MTEPDKQVDQSAVLIAELVRLEALSSRGVTLKVAGQTLIMKPVSWIMAKRIKDDVVSLVEKVRTSQDVGVQLDAMLEELLDVIFALFKPSHADLERAHLENITEPELRMCWEAFKYLNEGIVKQLGERLALWSPTQAARTTGSNSTLPQTLSESGS